MSVRLADGAILLSGDCPVEDAEELLVLLIQSPSSLVDVGDCGRIHTSVAQILLAARPGIRGVPTNSFFAQWILPLLLDPPAETKLYGPGAGAPGGAEPAPNR